MPEGQRATSPRALAGGRRPKRSVASIAQISVCADTRGYGVSWVRKSPHPDASRPTCPQRGEVKESPEVFIQREPINFRQPLEVAQRHALVDRVHGLPDEAELDHRAILRDEARVGGAAERIEIGAPS